jgi:putative FmdB family regulatory protein
MPIYEFKCRDCGRLTSVFVRNVGATGEATCQRCGSRDTERVISRFAYHKSEQAILEEYGSEPKRLEDYKDPRQIGRWVERKFKQYGMDVPDEARKMIDAARQGEFPETVPDS